MADPSPDDFRPPDHLEPCPPMTDELLAALALEITEGDALRDRLGLKPLNGRREYTAKRRETGRKLGPLATIDQGDLIVRLDN